MLNVAGIVFAFFALLDTLVPGLVVLAMVLSLVPHDIMYGPQAALIAESFPGRLRYSGASLGYQLSSLIAGGPAPLIAAALLSRYLHSPLLADFPDRDSDAQGPHQQGYFRRLRALWFNSKNLPQ